MKKWLVALGLLLGLAGAHAQIVGTLPYTLQNDTVADANQVMANFNAITTGVNANAATAGVNTNITALNGLTTPISPASGGSSVYAGGTSGGSANAQTIPSVIPTGFTLSTGRSVYFTAGYTNTAATTLNVASTGAVNIYRPTPSGPLPLAGGEIVGGNLVSVVYDGTQYQLVTQSSAVPPGTVLDFAGFNAPAGFLLAYGQAVSRTTYPGLFSILSIAITGTATNGSPIITGIASTTGLAIGMPLGGANVSCGATIVSVDSSTQITISSNASGSGSSALVVVPSGAGDCTTTFNIPDLRGRLTAGRDDMGGSAASRITNAASGVRGPTLGAAGGAQSTTLTTTELPAHTHTYSGTTSSNGAHTHTVNYGAPTGFSGTIAGSTSSGVAGAETTSSDGAHTHTYSGTTASTGTGSAFGSMNPVSIVNKIIKF